MEYGIIRWGVISCKAEPSHKAEQINQILFGETYIVEEESSEWLKIKTTFDSYVAWIDKKNHTPLTMDEFQNFSYEKASLTVDLINSVQNKKQNSSINVPIGSSLFTEDSSFQYAGKLSTKNYSSLIDFAMKFLNTPYLWGGRTPLGIDCSGFVQMIHKLCGIKLPRDSYQQAEVGVEIDDISNAQMGDLGFFGKDKIDHVGMLLSKNQIIHASGFVKIESIDKTGIIGNESKKYTHYLTKIKRLVM